MLRLSTFAALSEVTSAFLNSLQDAIVSFSQAKGTLVGAPYISCSGVSNDIIIGGIHGVLLVGHENENLNSSGSETTFTPGGLTNNTWNHLFAISSASTLAFAYATHAAGAPDQSLLFRSVGASALDQRRLCSFGVSSGGQIFGFRKVGNLHLWNITAHASATFRVLAHAPNAAASDVSFTDVNLGGFVAPISRMAKILVTYTPKTGAVGNASIRTKGTTGSAISIGSSDDTEGTSVVLDVLTDSSQKIQYEVTDANDGITIDVLGFYE